MTAPEHNHFADGVFRGKGSDNPCARCILEHAAPRMYDALRAIDGMKITEETDKGYVLAMCMTIARIELENIEGRE